jgi:putative ABC transport system substrate-binding protein
MDRRAFVTGTLALLPAPLAGRAQPAGKIHRIGFLSYLGCGASLAPDRAFRQGLRALGYLEGRNLVIECRDAVGGVDRLPALAVDLARLKVDVLVAEGTLSSLAAKRATTTIPIVILAVADPVGSGLVGSLARPGGNVTGVSLFPAIELTQKVLELLKEVVPHVSRVAVFMDQTNPGQLVTYDRMHAGARVLGIQPQRVDVQSVADLKRAFASALNQRAQALLAQPLPVPPPDIRQIADFALTKHLPAVTNWEGFAEQGFLMSYGTKLSDQYRQAGVYIDKILRGTKPADLPVEQPTKTAFVINLKTAKALGLRIPPSVLARADEVIE